jgi:hypothetical protein
MRWLRRDKGPKPEQMEATSQGCDHPVNYQEMVAVNPADPSAGKVLKCMQCGSVLAAAGKSEGAA